MMRDMWFTWIKLINLVRSWAKGDVHFFDLIKAGPQKLVDDGGELPSLVS